MAHRFQRSNIYIKTCLNFKQKFLRVCITSAYLYWNNVLLCTLYAGIELLWTFQLYNYVHVFFIKFNVCVIFGSNFCRLISNTVSVLITEKWILLYNTFIIKQKKWLKNVLSWFFFLIYLHKTVGECSFYTYFIL